MRKQVKQEIQRTFFNDGVIEVEDLGFKSSDNSGGMLVMIDPLRFSSLKGELLISCISSLFTDLLSGTKDVIGTTLT